MSLAGQGFHQSFANVQVNIVFQNLAGGYATKLATIMRSATPPDVVELDTAETGGFASRGALANITADKATFANSSTWRDVLTTSCTLNGDLFCVPYYAVQHNGSIIGGSDLAIPATAQHRSWAEAWIKAFTSSAAEQIFANDGRSAADGYVLLANTTSIS